MCPLQTEPGAALPTRKKLINNINNNNNNDNNNNNNNIFQIARKARGWFLFAKTARPRLNLTPEM